MAKKSQIGVFILLGVILVIGFGFMIYLRGGKVKEAEIEKISRLAFDAGPIKSYVESCIEAVGKDGISVIGPRGDKLVYNI